MSSVQTRFFAPKSAFSAPTIVTGLAKAVTEALTRPLYSSGWATELSEGTDSSRHRR